jgi:hypothetical protein
MVGLQQRLRQVVSGWGERVLHCNGERCAAPRRAWQRISNGAGSVCVHGLRYCFPHCFERELMRRLVRMQPTRAARRTLAHRLPLGLLMLSRGDLTDSQLRQTLQEQQLHKGRRIGECMQQLGYVREPQVTAALAMQWCCPVLKTLPQHVIDCGVPQGLLRRFRMMPVHFSAATRALYIAFVEDIEYPALIAIEQMLDCKTQACLTTSSGLQTAFERMEQQSMPLEKEFAGLRAPEEMTRITSSYAARLFADDVRAVACGDLAWVRVDGGRDPMNLLFHLPN